jgi:hypothetical protein
MGTEVKSRRDRAMWAVADVIKKASPGFYGSFKIYYENGFVTHVEGTERQKAPVDMQKTEG